MIESDLQERLKNWAQEYGGGRTQYIGFNSRNLLQVLIDHKGEVPSSRGYIPVPTQTAADDIEEIVVAMQIGGRFKIAMVLRCEYFNPHAPIEQKLARLRDIGLPMSRAGFYNFLKEAVAYVDGALEALRRAHDPFRREECTSSTCV